MSYFSSNKREWYELDGLNLSGTQSGGTSLNIPTVGTWTTLARFDNEDINLDFVLYRSSIQEDGSLSSFIGASGTSSVSLRILPPNSNLGLSIFNNIVVGTDAESISIVQSDFTPSRNIPKGSLLQGRVTGVSLAETTGTNNRMYLHFAFEHRGHSPQITSLVDY
jgi:hypothetical protein